MVTDTIPRAASTEGGHANFGRLLTAEWTKLRTVRSTVWSFAALIIAVLGFTALITFLTVQQWSQMSFSDRATVAADPIGHMLGAGLYFGQAAVCVLGVLVASSEYTTGMIRSTLLASPHRLRMLAAKCIVFTVPVIVITEVLSFASFGIGSSILHSKVPVSLSDPYVMRAVVGVGLYLTMLGLFSVAIGQLIRHTAGAVTATLVIVLLLVPIAGLLPGSIGKHVSAYLPTNAGQQIMQVVPEKAQILSAWEGFGIFGLWTAVLLAVAAWLLVKRDA